MKITFKSSCLVKPAEQIYQGCFPLSVRDQIGCIMHVPTIYFCRPKQHWLEPAHCIIKSLESSLSMVLVHFYPLAGHLRCIGGGRLEVDCNAAGAQLIEVESNATLADLGDFSPSAKFYYFFPSIDYKDAPFEEHPLLYVQLAKFQCGGISLSLAISHAVVDERSALHFTSKWAGIARREPLGIAPFFNREVFRAGDCLPLPYLANPVFQHDQYRLPSVLNGESSNESETLLKLTKHHVETLKNEANTGKIANMGFPYTYYEVRTAHAWRSACRAQKLTKEQPTSLGICVDLRKRMQPPPLPKGYFGNAIIDVIASGYYGELLSQPLSYATSKIREAVSHVTNEYVYSAMDFMETQKDMSRFQNPYALKHGIGPFNGNTNLGVILISWLTLPLYDLDFGWGKELYMSPGTHESCGDFLIIPGHEGDGSLAVALCLQDSHIEAFTKTL